MNFRKSVRGSSFVITDAHKKIVVIGCIRIEDDSAIEVEQHAINIVLKVVAEWRMNITIIFTDCIRAKQVLQQDINDNAWRIDQQISDLKCTHDVNNINIDVIPRDWDILANKLAAQGRHSHGISFNHLGLDLPRWSMKSAKNYGLYF